MIKYNRIKEGDDDSVEGVDEWLEDFEEIDTYSDDENDSIDLTEENDKHQNDDVKEILISNNQKVKFKSKLDHFHFQPESSTHLAYGSHIMLHCSQLHLSNKTSLDFYRKDESILSNVSSIHLSTLSSCVNQLLVRETDLVKMVVEALLGTQNDLFRIMFDTVPYYYLTVTARMMCLKTLSSLTLNSMLERFAAVASLSLKCRSFVSKQASNRNPNDSVNGGLTDWANTVCENVRNVLRSFLSRMDLELVKVEENLCRGSSRTSVRSLVGMYRLMIPWSSALRGVSPLVTLCDILSAPDTSERISAKYTVACLILKELSQASASNSLLVFPDNPADRKFSELLRAGVTEIGLSLALHPTTRSEFHAVCQLAEFSCLSALSALLLKRLLVERDSGSGLSPLLETDAKTAVRLLPSPLVRFMTVLEAASADVRTLASSTQDTLRPESDAGRPHYSRAVISALSASTRVLSVLLMPTYAVEEMREARLLSSRPETRPKRSLTDVSLSDQLRELHRTAVKAKKGLEKKSHTLRPESTPTTGSHSIQRQAPSFSDANGTESSVLRQLLQMSRMASPSHLFAIAIVTPVAEEFLSRLRAHAVRKLLDDCGLAAQLRYLGATFLLSQPGLFDALKLVVSEWIERTGRQGGGKLSMDIAGLLAVRTLTDQLSLRLRTAASNVGLLHISVAFGDSELDEELRATGPQSVGQALIARLGEGHPLSLAGRLQLELHHSSPVSTYVTEESLVVYGSHLRLLLRLHVVLWVAESALLGHLKSLQLTAGDNNQPSARTSKGDLQVLRRRCCAGLSALLNLLNGLVCFVQLRVHGRIVPQLQRQLGRCAGVADVAEAHSRFVPAISTVFPSTVKSLLLRLLRQSLTTLHSVILASAAAQTSEVGRLYQRALSSSSNSEAGQSEVVWLMRAVAGFGAVREKAADVIAAIDHCSDDFSFDLRDLQCLVGDVRLWT